MDAEIFINADKLVVAKEGFDASNPSLPEGNKLFDSDWLFAGNVVQAGLHIDRASYKWSTPPQNLTRWDEATDDSSPQFINFTPLPYVPTVMLISLADSRYWNDHGMVLFSSEPKIPRSEYYRMGEITVSNSQIRIPRIRSPEWYYKESFIYVIMGM